MKDSIKSLLVIFVIFYQLLIFGNIKTAAARGNFSAEFMPGGAIIFESPLFIHQEGCRDLQFTARYRTESFKLPLHYSIRLGYNFNKTQGLELEFNHLKIILDNTSDEIKRFSITHGFNQFWINYLHSAFGFDFRTGLGPVLAHPESIVRGKKFDEFGGIAQSGYHICGITAQFSAQKKFFIGRYFFISAEAKINPAWANVPISGGYAKVWVLDLQGLAGIGITF